MPQPHEQGESKDATSRASCEARSLRCGGRRGFDIQAAMWIVLAVAAMGMWDIDLGGLNWSDAPQHVFDGIFVLEFCKAWPLDNPQTWAEQFYIRFPSLGIFVYYPPGFAAVEGLVFAVFGVGVMAARLTILAYAIGAGWLMFVLGRRWFDRPTGILAALLLITSAHGALWLNDIMLEWPATFWMLAAVYAYQRDRDECKARWAIAMCLVWVAAFLTKQTAGFIVPVLLLHAVLQPDRRRYFARYALVGGLIAASSTIVSYALLTRRFAALPATLLEPTPDLWFYPRHLPEIVGPALLPLVLLGLLTFVLRPDRRVRGLLLLWFAAWAAFSSLIEAKEPRYFFFALPPLMFAAARFLLPREADGSEREISWVSDKPRIALLAILIVAQCVLWRMKDVGRLPDYSETVSVLAHRDDADLVLVDAVRDGQFVFDVYLNPAAREHIVPLRASKLLYARAARAKYGYQQFVESPDDIVALLDKYAIRYIVIESDLPRTHYIDADPPPRRMLRSLLSGDARFRLLDAWPLRCGDPIWDDVELQLYEYADCPERQSREITLSFPGMGRETTFVLP